jgi:hypothetical protein
MDPTRGLTGYTAPRTPNGHFRLTTHGSPPTSRLGGFLLRIAWLGDFLFFVLETVQSGEQIVGYLFPSFCAGKVV